MSKLTYSFVADFFRKQGCELLASEYVNTLTNMPYICQCGRKANIRFQHFQRGIRCRQCGNDKIGAARRFDLSYVKKYFKDAGCTLLASEYQNSKTKMPYICICGRQATICYSHFQRGRRCKKCGIEKIVNSNKKYDYVYVKEFFEKQGCKLFMAEKDYINSDMKTSYICQCGAEASTRIIRFLKGGIRCQKNCLGDKLRKRFQHTFASVKQFFQDAGCLLLATEYKNAMTKMPYVCSCGQESEIRYSSFKAGGRCFECRNQKISTARKHSYEYVKLFFAEHGCLLLSKEYKSGDLPLLYICECGDCAEVRFDSFISGVRCKKCGVTKMLQTRELHEKLLETTTVDLDEIIAKRREELASSTL